MYIVSFCHDARVSTRLQLRDSGSAARLERPISLAGVSS